jgi:hypothetical protein
LQIWNEESQTSKKFALNLNSSDLFVLRMGLLIYIYIKKHNRVSAGFRVDRVLPGQILDRFFHQPGPVPASGQPGPRLTWQAGPDFKTMVYSKAVSSAAFKLWTDEKFSFTTHSRLEFSIHIKKKSKIQKQYCVSSYLKVEG